MEPEPAPPTPEFTGRPRTASLLPQPHISVAPPAKPGAMENPDVCFSGRQSRLCSSASARMIRPIRSGRGIRGRRPAKKPQRGSERQSPTLFFDSLKENRNKQLPGGKRCWLGNRGRGSRSGVWVLLVPEGASSHLRISGREKARHHWLNEQGHSY